MLLHYMPAVLMNLPFPECSEKETYLLVVSSNIALGTTELAYLPQPLNKRGSFLVLLVRQLRGFGVGFGLQERLRKESFVFQEGDKFLK